MVHIHRLGSCCCCSCVCTYTHVGDVSTCIAGRLTFNPDTITVRISKLSQLAPAVRPYMGLLWVCAMYIMRYVWESLTRGVYTSLLREEVREGGREEEMVLGR